MTQAREVRTVSNVVVPSWVLPGSVTGLRPDSRPGAPSFLVREVLVTDLNPADLRLVSHTMSDSVTTRELVLGDVT
jgi:hypothetical protein